MKVTRYQAHNVLKVQDIDWNLEGHNLFLVGGRNDQGKTSALTALLMALCGRSGMDWPELALKDGESEGWVKVDLAPDPEDAVQKTLTVELFLKKRRGGNVVEQFKIVDEEGSEAPEPRALLKRLYELRAFDPLAFERMDRKGKRALLQKLVGLDFTEQNLGRDKLYKEREAVNRDAKRAKAQLDGLKQHRDAPAEEVKASDLLVELENRKAHNARNKAEREKIPDLESKVKFYEQERITVAQQIAALQKRAEELAACSEQQTILLKAQEATVAVLKDADEGEVRNRIDQADETNRKVRENRKRAEVEAEVKRLDSESNALTVRMDEIADAQGKALASAKWPVEGLSFDEEGVLWHNIPFEQTSKSKRVLASVQIGMALNPRMKLLVCQDGNDLDTESLEALEQVLRERGWQMILEVVTRGEVDESRCAVVIEDGKQK